MHYGVDGSGSSTSYIAEQLRVRFGYRNAALRRGNIGTIGNDEQIAAMLTSFDIGSPCAVGISGHSILSDGYGYSDGRLFIHFNWGWSTNSRTAWYSPPEDEAEASEAGRYPGIGSIVYNIWTPNEREDSDVSVIVGTLLDASSNAVASATVTATSLTTETRYTATTDERGAYALFLPGDDTYALTAVSGGGATAWRTLAVKTCTIDTVGNQRGIDLTLGSAGGGVDDLGWVCEKMETKEMTGSWEVGKVSYDPATGKAELEGDYAFKPTNDSNGGTPVTMTVTATFSAVPGEEATPDATAQGAVWIGTNGTFQVWTGTQNGWIDVEADGVTPQTGVDYTFRFVFDYKAEKYGVEVATPPSSSFVSLRATDDGGVVATQFPIAASTSVVSRVRFSGEGTLTSILGEYVKVEGFAVDDEVILKDNATVILTAAKAAWLNNCTGGKAAVSGAAARLSSDDFDKAYLLNLDIAGIDDVESSYSFKITGVEVGANNVTVGVTLTRIGKVAQSINGKLKFYGAETLEAFANPAIEALSSDPISDADFSEGDTATATYPKVNGSATNTFFKAKIEK